MSKLPEFVKAGAVLLINKQASIQFAIPFMFRVIRVTEHTHLSAWVWLEGYQLRRNGNAVCRREIYVRINGLMEFSSLILQPPKVKLLGKNWFNS